MKLRVVGRRFYWRLPFRKIDETPIYAHHFTEQSQIVLEKAWNDIKRDLGTETKED